MAGCHNCGRAVVYSRPQTAQDRLREVFTSRGGSQETINFKARNRRVVGAFCGDLWARVTWTPEAVTFVAPPGARIVVETIIES